MLAGTVVTSVLGGLLGLAYGISQDHGVLHSLFSYQIGALATAITFMSLVFQRRMTQG